MWHLACPHQINKTSFILWCFMIKGTIVSSSRLKSGWLYGGVTIWLDR